MTSLLVRDESHSLNEGRCCARIEPRLGGLSSYARLSSVGSWTFRTRRINGFLKNCTSLSVADSLVPE